MAMDGCDGALPGSPEWARTQMLAIAGSGWADAGDGAELVDWLYTVAKRRARRLSLRGDDLAEVVQDSMVHVVRSISSSAQRYACAVNTAAVLERVVGIAVVDSCHCVRMRGYGGVHANGEHIHDRYPVRVSGVAGESALERPLAPSRIDLRPVEDLARRTTQWVRMRIGVELTPGAADAVVYVLDRLCGGLSRTSLLRGGHSRLRVDPAMRHLGLSERAAGGFAVWLLGRNDHPHQAPAVLDAALSDTEPPPMTIHRWRRNALRFGFAVPILRPADQANTA